MVERLGAIDEPHGSDMVVIEGRLRGMRRVGRANGRTNDDGAIRIWCGCGTAAGREDEGVCRREQIKENEMCAMS